MVYDILEWLTDNWEPVVVVVGISLGIMGSVMLFLYFKSRDPLSRALDRTTDALLKSNEAVLKSQQSQIEVGAALTIALKRETEYNQKVIDLQNQIDALQDKVKDIQGEYDKQCQLLMAELDAAKTRLTTAEAGWNKRLNELEGQTYEQEKKIALLEQAVKERDKRIADLEHSLIERDQRIAELTAKVEEMQKRGTGPLSENKDGTSDNPHSDPA